MNIFIESFNATDITHVIRKINVLFRKKEIHKCKISSLCQMFFFLRKAQESKEIKTQRKG